MVGSVFGVADYDLLLWGRGAYKDDKERDEQEVESELHGCYGSVGLSMELLDVVRLVSFT